MLTCALRAQMDLYDHASYDQYDRVELEVGIDPYASYHHHGYEAQSEVTPGENLSHVASDENLTDSDEFFSQYQVDDDGCRCGTSDLPFDMGGTLYAQKTFTAATIVGTAGNPQSAPFPPVASPGSDDQSQLVITSIQQPEQVFTLVPRVGEVQLDGAAADQQEVRGATAGVAAHQQGAKQAPKKKRGGRPSRNPRNDNTVVESTVVTRNATAGTASKPAYDEQSLESPSSPPSVTSRAAAPSSPAAMSLAASTSSSAAVSRMAVNAQSDEQFSDVPQARAMANPWASPSMPKKKVTTYANRRKRPAPSPTPPSSPSPPSTPSPPSPPRPRPTRAQAVMSRPLAPARASVATPAVRTQARQLLPKQSTEKDKGTRTITARRPSAPPPAELQAPPAARTRARQAPPKQSTDEDKGSLRRPSAPAPADSQAPPAARTRSRVPAKQPPTLTTVGENAHESSSSSSSSPSSSPSSSISSSSSQEEEDDEDEYEYDEAPENDADEADSSV